MTASRAYRSTARLGLEAGSLRRGRDRGFQRAGSPLTLGGRQRRPDPASGLAADHSPMRWDEGAVAGQSGRSQKAVTAGGGTESRGGGRGAPRSERTEPRGSALRVSLYYPRDPFSAWYDPAQIKTVRTLGGPATSGARTVLLVIRPSRNRQAHAAPVPVTGSTGGKRKRGETAPGRRDLEPGVSAETDAGLGPHPPGRPSRSRGAPSRRPTGLSLRRRLQGLRQGCQAGRSSYCTENIRNRRGPRRRPAGTTDRPTPAP